MSVAGAIWQELMRPEGPGATLIRIGATPQVVAQHYAGLVYLATPYRGIAAPDGVWRYDLSVRAQVLAGRHIHLLARAGVPAVSAVVQQAEAAHARETIPRPRLTAMDAEVWSGCARAILNTCRMVVVPDIEGWHLSEGVALAVHHAVSHNMGVFLYARPGVKSRKRGRQ